MAVDADRLAAVLGVDATRAAELLAAATPFIDRYAPRAPTAVKDEALLRVAGWMAQAPAGGQRSKEAGPLRADYSPSATGAMRASGAKGLLSPWRVRRAGAA